MKTRITLFFAAVLLSSCKSPIYYQVYKTESASVKPVAQDRISYEDNDCRIDYNLWKDRGNAGFTFYNKTNEVIHVHLEESFYVLNGHAYDYYQNRIYSDGSNVITKVTRGMGVSGIGASGLGWMTMYSNSTVSNAQHSVSVVENAIISIPPKTSKTITEFDINQTLYRDCDLWLYPSRRQVKGKTFTATTSPLQFYNRISYTAGTATQRTTVNNDFYVSEITNYPESELFKNADKAFCGQKDYSAAKTFKDSAPNWFYLRYNSDSDYWKH